VGDLTSVARYRRTIGASLERVWENVLDWEHLPWLHASAFRSIECQDAGDWGWRARAVARGGSDEPIEIELRVDRPASRYVTRTLSGPGAGTEIWTSLDGRGERETAIEVDFRMANLDPAHADALGKVWLALYAQLWDEDEGMMQERQRQLDARAASGSDTHEVRRLGSLDEVRARLPMAFELAGRRFRLIELDGELIPHGVVCPHSLGPLDESAVEDGVIRCPWHGYRFDVRTGQACDHAGIRLARPPRIEIDEGSLEVRAVWIH